MAQLRRYKKEDSHRPTERKATKSLSAWERAHRDRQQAFLLAYIRDVHVRQGRHLAAAQATKPVDLDYGQLTARSRKWLEQ